MASSGDAGAPSLKPFRNKQRVLVLASRTITARNRHLMNDLISLLPHAKKDIKFDSSSGDTLQGLNELCDLKNCNNCVFFEGKKNGDLYMWVAKVPNGPSAKFYVQNVHTLDELKMTGNCLKGSRPILSFDKSFEESPEAMLIKELFVQVFGTPRRHPRSKPFIDHTFLFSIQDGRIWFRNYEILNEDKGGEDLTLAEVGPRFALQLVRVFDGSFGGPTLYDNPHFVSPNELRREAKKKAREKRKWADRKEEKTTTKKRKAEAVIPENEVESIFDTKKKHT